MVPFLEYSQQELLINPWPVPPGLPCCCCVCCSKAIIPVSVLRYDWCTPLSHLSSCMPMNNGPSQQRTNTSHGNEVLPQDAMHLIQRPCHCYQWGSLCQDPAGNGTTWGPPEYLKRHKLKWYEHVSRSSGVAKTILQGTVKKRRRWGRQKKRWEDNIREWTGLEFAKSQRAVKNIQKWRQLVVKSSVVP